MQEGDDIKKQELIQEALDSLNEQRIDSFINKFNCYPFDNATAIIIHATSESSLIVTNKKYSKYWLFGGILLLCVAVYGCWKYKILV